MSQAERHPISPASPPSGSPALAPGAIPPRRFVMAFLSTALVGCLSVAGINYVVNPLGYYSPQVVQPLVWRDQIIKLDLMKKGPAPDVLILGSSRTMKLAPADIETASGLTAFNGGVSTSRPEEWYTMLRYALDDLHWQPKELILGVDMETLFYAGEPNEALVSRSEFRRFLPTSMWVGGFWERTKQMVSFDQLKMSKKAVTLALGPTTPLDFSFEPDGLLHYLVKEQQVAEGTYKLQAAANAGDYRLRYEGAAAFNPERKALFEKILQVTAEKGIKVRLFLTPFHPALLGEMQKLPTFTHVYATMTPYLQELQSRYPNLHVADLTDISTFGGDPNDFFDGVHYRQENAQKIISYLYRMQ